MTARIFRCGTLYSSEQSKFIDIFYNFGFKISLCSLFSVSYSCEAKTKDLVVQATLPSTPKKLCLFITFGVSFRNMIIGGTF